MEQTNALTPDTHLSNSSLRESISSAEASLYNKMMQLDVENVALSEYTQRYLKNKFANLKGILQLYGSLLYLSLKDPSKPLDQVVLVDYGGGTGLISYLAAELGVGTVFYSDIYDVSCNDVANLSKALSLKLDHIVCGDIDEILQYIETNSVSIDVITSYDVLEHIYDVESHFQKLCRFSGKPFRIIYGSGANIKNPHYVKSVRKIHNAAEYDSREKEWGHKERDSLTAFLDIRKLIISEYATDLDKKDVEHLATATRGLMKPDIENCVDEFRANGKISYRSVHPTNTCDPYTGNWAEHLMDFGWLKGIFDKEGMDAQILPGHYATHQKLAKRSIKIVLNGIISAFGKHALAVAPHYIVHAEIKN